MTEVGNNIDFENLESSFRESEYKSELKDQVVSLFNESPGRDSEKNSRRHQTVIHSNKDFLSVSARKSINNNKLRRA